MKKTLRKITTVLLVLMLTAGLIASAMADTVYITEGFTIPIGRIEGERPVTETPEPTPAAPEDELVDPIGNPDEPQETDEQKPEEALDENVEGLAVVEGEEKTEDASITEQTEVRTNEAGTENSVEIDVNDVMPEPVENIPEESQPEVNIPEAGNTEDEMLMIQIRRDPNGLSEILAEAPVGTELEVFDQVDSWYLVLYEDVAGYVHASQMPGVKQVIDEDVGQAKKVLIFSSQKPMVTDGETIHLTSVLEGFEGIEVEYYWQYDRGNGWEEIPGANDPDYYFTANAETLSYNWRLRVHFEENQE